MSKTWIYSSQCSSSKRPPVLSLEQLFEDHGYPHEWTCGEKPHLIQNGRRIPQVFVLTQGDGQTVEENKEGRRKRVSRPYNGCDAIEMSISGRCAAEIQIDFTEGHELIDTIKCVQFAPAASRPAKIGRKKTITRGDSTHFTSAVSLLPNWRNTHKKIPWQQSDRPTQCHISRFRKFGVFRCHPY